MNEPPPAISLAQGKFLPPTLDLLIKGLLVKNNKNRINDPEKTERMLYRAISEEPEEKSLPVAATTVAAATSRYGLRDGTGKTIRGTLKAFDKTPSLAVRVLIVSGIIGAAAILISYISGWKYRNEYNGHRDLVDSTMVALNDPAGFDTMLVRPAIDSMAKHRKAIYAGRVADTITTTIEYPDGVYVGQVVRNVKNGLGTFFWNDGDRYSGFFVNGEKEGKGTFYYKNRDQYSGEWKNGKKSGNGILYTNEMTYQGEFADDFFEGFGTLTVNNNRIVVNCAECTTYKGYWRGDKKEGFGECFDKDGLLIYQGRFSDDQPVEEYPNVERIKN